MKKLFTLFTVILLVISLIACGKVREEEMAENPDVKQDIAQQNKEDEKSKGEKVPEVSVPEGSSGGSASSDNSSDTGKSAQDGGFFSSLPKEFIYSAGTGGWRTSIKLNSDGSFVGSYTDDELGETDSKYPDGTVIECRFKGRFSQPIPLDEYTYVSVLEEYEVTNPAKGEVIKDKVRHIYKEEGGLENMKEVVFYMPGAPTKAISDDFLVFMPGYDSSWEKLPYNLYGIFDMNNRTGFFAKK